MLNGYKRKLRHKLDLQTFAEDKPDPETPAPVESKKLELTQEEFDAKIEERLARERKKYAGYDEMKTKLTAFEQAEVDRKNAELTEADRLKAERDEADRKAAESEGKAADALKTANNRLIKAEFRLLAKDAGVRADAVDDAFLLADVSAITVDDEGNVVGAKEVVDALLAAKPYLAEPAKKPGTIGGPSGGDNREKAEKTKEQLLADAAEKARKSGRIEDRVAYSDLKAKFTQ